MDFIKQWTVSICITVLISVIFSMLSPKGNMKKTYKVLISFFIFVSFLYPLKESKLTDLSALFENGTSKYETYSEDSALIYENMIETQVKRVLENNNIIGAAVKSTVNIGSGEVEVESVEVAVSDEYDKDNVKNIIYDTLQINATVTGIGQ